ncbi:Lipoma HMGIC fusion partner [Fasciolopsis buskii]|uniref:Lipoma HMGIC fusion partner n=1 Tax=Fasciolopsis buskii TaxID=27845 RepID=A0A8E0VQ48_9TREM|nr:Lipoma HMGIC fusion partner [Fasciolopsis buski]
MRCIWLLWSSLAWLTAVLCTVGCLLPYWLKGSVYISTPTKIPANKVKTDPDSVEPINLGNRVLDKPIEFPTDLGLFRRCGYPVYAAWISSESTPTRGRLQPNRGRPPVQWQTGCGHYSHLTDVPHLAWHIGFILLIIACSLQFFTTFFLFLMGFTLYLITVRSVYRACQTMLLVAGCLTLTACILYPVGWTNSEVKQACGEEAYGFHLGRCHIGWAFVLTCSGGLLSVFASTLPVIFPKHIKQNPTSGFRSLTDSGMHTNESIDRGSKLTGPTVTCPCGCGPSSSTESLSRIGSTPAGSVAAFVQRSAPSPTHLVDMSQRNSRLLLRPGSEHQQQQQKGSVLYLPVSSTAVCLGDRQSPCGSSSSPAAGSSVHETPCSGKLLIDQTVFHSSCQNLAPVSRQLLRPGYTNHPLLASYAPQRYSTGALLGQFYPIPAYQRIAPSLNTDPLIYVTEEDECDHDHMALNGPLPDVAHVVEVLDTEPDMNEDAQTESSPPNIRANPGRDDDNDNDDDAVASITCPTAQSDLRHGPLEISHSSGQDAMPVRWISPQTYKNPILATSVQSGDMKQSTTNDAEQNQTEEQLTTCVL